MNSEESRNLILAIALSALVMVGWFFFFGSKLQPGSGLLAPMASSTQPAATGSGSTPASAATAPQPGAPALDAVAPRETVIGASARVAIDTPALGGSIDLTGGSFDDLILKGYRETIDPKSPNIALFSPAGSPQPYWAETGFVTDAAGVKTPNRTTVWTADAATLTPKQPVTLSWDNGAGLKFSRKIEVDDRYLFTVTDSVENTGAAAVALRPYSLILRRGKPAVSGYAVLHEGFVGVIGDSSVQEITYPNIEKETGRVRALKGDGGWLGFTDKYWAAVVIPDPKEPVEARFSGSGPTTLEDYQTDFVGAPRAVCVAPAAPPMLCAWRRIRAWVSPRPRANNAQASK